MCNECGDNFAQAELGPPTGFSYAQRGVLLHGLRALMGPDTTDFRRFHWTLQVRWHKKLANLAV